MKKLILKYGLIIIFLGVGLLTAVILIEEGYHPAPHSAAGFALRFGEHLGIAFLSIGAIGLMLEIPELHDYFHKQLVETLVDDKYLEKLSKEELEEHQTKVLKLFFNVKDLDKPGSFFEFHREKIQQYIGKPYREGTRAVTNLTYSEDGKYLVAEENISYKCRKLGKDIQEELKWVAEPDEMQEVRSFEFFVRVPDEVFGSKGFSANYPKVPAQEVVYGMNGAGAGALKKNEHGHGYTLPLDAYKDRHGMGIDGLYVETRVTYTVAVGRPFPWTMPVPSKGLSGVITFPPELKIYIDLFGMDDKVLKPSKAHPGIYTYDYAEWLLPGDGFAYHFQRAAAETEKGRGR